MEKEIFDALREVFVLLVVEMQAALRPFHLTPEQFDTLHHLQLEDGWRMGDLGNKVLCDNSKMTRIVDYLAVNGWVERQPDPTDRRAQQVFLTPAGAAQRQAAQVAHLAALQASLTEFTPDKQTQLLDLLATWHVTLRQD